MNYVVLVDGKIVDTAETEDEARQKAETVQANPSQFVGDEMGGAFSIVGFASADDLANVSNLKPRESVPDALVPREFRQLR